MLNYFPKYFTSKAIYLYMAVLVMVSIIFMQYTMSWYWYLFGLIAVAGFFFFSNTLSKTWSKLSEKIFTKRLFTTALILRLIWVVFSYFFYIQMTGQPFEFFTGDSWGYNQCGEEIAAALRDGNWNIFGVYIDIMGVSDTGYISYLGVLYWLTGDSIFIARVIKALLSGFTVVLIYRLAARNFGESTGRMAGIFCMLMPNLIYYCGLHLKETEMLFFTVAFVERADNAIRSAKFTFGNLILPILLASVLFTFRTVLGAATLFSFFTALVFSTKKVGNISKRFVLIIWVVAAVVFFMGGKIATEVEEVWENKNTNQQTSMQWRAERKGGNAFAKYASGTVFAPLILIIPFPTMINIEYQPNQQLLHGGYYVKNILAFFVMFAIVMVIKNKKWRENLLISSFMFGYLIVIALSAFAQSERFHLPALPFFLIFAAVGVSYATNKTKIYYMWYSGFIFVAIIVWSWFKLAGRGLV